MARQLTSTGYFSCIIEDTYTYISWASQFVEALKEGVIYPRWMPLNYWGYGGPTFILYPPLAFYIVSFFNVFSDSIILAMNFTKLASLFVGAMGMYFFVKEFYPSKTALLTAVFYTIFPYHIFQYYFVGTFASIVSFMWFPFILLFMHRYIKNDKYRELLLAGLCYSGLILTHLINGYMFTFVMIAFILYMSSAEKKWKALIGIPVLLSTGCLISAAYLLPIIYERHFLNLKYFIGIGSDIYFKFYNFFIFPNMTHKLSHGHLMLTFYSTFVFFLFFFCILILFYLVQAAKLGKSQIMAKVKSVNIFFLGTTVICIFFLFGISRFLWEAIPYFDYIQFPTRWLNIASPSIIFLSAFTFTGFSIKSRTKNGHITFIILLFIACISLDAKYISSANIFDQQKLLPIRGADWNLEHLPVWVAVENIDMDNSHTKVTIIEGKGKAEVIRWSSDEKIITTTAVVPMELRLRSFYFPGWKVYKDGMAADIEIEKRRGTILVSVPKGQHTIEIRFQDTPVRYYGKMISLVSLLSTIVLVIIPFPRQGK
jgi:hypothetical protein